MEPVDVADDPIINDGSEILDVPSGTPTGTPRRIATVQRNPPNNEDMLSETNGDVTGIYNWHLNRPDEDYFSSMKWMFWWFTFYDKDLTTIGDLMIDKFKNKSGGTFENPVLNDKVSQSSALYNFIKTFRDGLDAKIKSSGGIDNVTTLALDFRPIFNGWYNTFHGLQILINDTEKTEID
jgi:hypothetical protein